MVNAFTLTHFHVLSNKELTNTYSAPEYFKKIYKMKSTQKNMSKKSYPLKSGEIPKLAENT